MVKINIQELLNWNLLGSELDSICTSLSLLKAKSKDLKSTALPRIRLYTRFCSKSGIRYCLEPDISFRPERNNWISKKRPIFFKFNRIDDFNFILFEHEDGNLILKSNTYCISISHDQYHENKILFENHYIYNPFLSNIDSNYYHFTRIDKFVEFIRIELTKDLITVV